MIFVTVGTQAPFDRLLEYIDDIFYQLGEELVVQAPNSAYTPKNFTILSFLDPVDFDRYVINSKFIIGHAGMGSIITALKYNTPIVIVPRDSRLKEHRTNHQIATSKKMIRFSLVEQANSKEELLEVCINLQKKRSFRVIRVWRIRITKSVR